MIGILLAAGFSRRFGAEDKLLQLLPDGREVALTAAQHLIDALPLCIAVVRAENPLLGEALKTLGLHVVYCQNGATEMADSLVAGVQYASTLQPDAMGFVIALADMPYISPNTIRAVVNQISSGAEIVLPTYHGRRGHPVGFSSKYRTDLMLLNGDEGARSIIKQHAEKVMLLPCDDAGILADIDTPADLAQPLAKPE